LPATATEPCTFWANFPGQFPVSQMLSPHLPHRNKRRFSILFFLATAQNSLLPFHSHCLRVVHPPLPPLGVFALCGLACPRMQLPANPPGLEFGCPFWFLPCLSHFSALLQILFLRFRFFPPAVLTLLRRFGPLFYTGNPPNNPPHWSNNRSPEISACWSTKLPFELRLSLADLLILSATFPKPPLVIVPRMDQLSRHS